MAFQLPPIHNFPPFFTKQPNLETYNSQKQQWAVIILAYFKHNRRFRMRLNHETLSDSLFTNVTISRSLKLDTLREIVEFMVSQGQAEWVSKKQRDEVLVYWRSRDDWAQLLSKHIDSTGQSNVILTVYELTEADEARNTEFWQMDKVMLKKVVEVLAKKGKAIIMQGSDGEEQGIKFF